MLKLYAKTTQLCWINLEVWSPKGFYRSYGSTQARPKPSHSHPYHLVKRGSQTACNCKHDYHDSYTLCKGKHPISTSSDFIAKRLEKPPFCHSYTSFGVWPRYHYMSLRRSYTRLSKGSHSTTAPLAPCEPRWVTTPISHSSEHDTLPIAYLISKQAVPYQTRGGTRYLADSSVTNHITWRNPTVYTILNLAQTTTLNLTMVTSHHDGWKTITLNNPRVQLNIIKMERLAPHSRLHGLA
jgi:hypothetical protein